MIISKSIIEKYNTAVPRYTSYPTVPHWQPEKPDTETYLESLRVSLKKDNKISLYVHLPFCEQLCTYCGCNKRITKNHQVEDPYIDTVLKEWNMLVSDLGIVPIIEEIHLGGGTPTFFSPESLKRLIEGIISKGIVSANPSFGFEAHPNSTTDEHLETLYKLGFKRMSIGVQDVSPFILKAINRYQTLDQIKNSVAKARLLGFNSINFDLVYGLPFQTIDDIRETVKFTNEIRPDRIAYYGYAHVPWKSKGQRAFTEADIPWGYEKYLLREEADNLLQSIGYQSLGLDHYALPQEELSVAYQAGKLHRNFMGYTTVSTNNLIGLGVSSISEISDHYMQNEKTVEEYSAKIDAGFYSYNKGHKLSYKEIKMKEYIKQLMCQGKLEWNEDSMINKIVASHLGEIKEMEDDELVFFSGHKLQLSGKGQFLVRNICALIDPLYENHSEKLFSKAI